MIRLDVFLTNNGYIRSRQRAKALIEGGYVIVNSKKITKPSFLIDESITQKIEINDPCPYVSRGGLKLEKMINEGNVDFNGKIVIDIGASTGGFTDCSLKHGASKVYAVDSGTNQLDLSLKNDPRVVSIENYNARDINYEDMGSYCDIVTIDVSFISQTYIMPSAIKLLNENGVYMSLIKPQFEVGREKIGKGGIVKKPSDRLFGVLKVINCASENGLACVYFSVSPILGGDGNVEFLAIFSKSSENIVDKNIIEKIVLNG